MNLIRKIEKWLQIKDQLDKKKKMNIGGKHMMTFLNLLRNKQIALL